MHTLLVRLAANLLYTEDASTEAEPEGAKSSGRHEELQLHMEKLEAFGGVDEVARQFRGAASSEARRNMLCVLLDCIAAHSSRVGSLSPNSPGWLLQTLMHWDPAA